MSWNANQTSRQVRQMAESFGSDAERYDRTRPHYPDALIDQIVAASPGRELLDVGCGTGIVARQLQAAGCQVLGVEIDPRMAEFARRGGVEVEIAKFEEWDAAGRRFDAILSGQTWHWIDPIAGAAKAGEVLRPGGRLTVFWNAGQTTPELAEAFANVYRRVLPDLPFTPQWGPSTVNAYLALREKAADGIRQSALFGEPERWRSDWDQAYTNGAWLDQVPTHGGHSRLPPDQLAELLAGLGAVIDATGGSFTMRYATVTVTATRLADSASERV